MKILALQLFPGLLELTGMDRTGQLAKGCHLALSGNEGQ